MQTHGTCIKNQFRDQWPRIQVATHKIDINIFTNNN